MKKLFLTILFTACLSGIFAQTISDSVSLGIIPARQEKQPMAADSVSLGASAGGFSYPNDIYYSLKDGIVSTSVGYNWHIAFAVRKATSQADATKAVAVLANEGRGVAVYESSHDWSTFDTAGYTNWPTPHNSDSTWDLGAFNTNRNPANPFDFGWGTYDILTNNIAGTKVFLVKITVGSGPSATITLKKLVINLMERDFAWTFRYANIDNSDSTLVTIRKDDYPGKLFAYYNLVTNVTSDREPSAKWDVLFTRYGAYATQFGQTIFSANTGVLSHPTIMTSKVTGIPVDSAGAGVYTDKITAIGTDWKENPGPGQPNFLVKDSISYFTKDAANDEYKLAFIALRGSATGTIVFKKASTKLVTVAPAETYPNDVFYSMKTGTVETTRGNNWHLAFAMRNAAPPANVLRSATVLANEGRGVSVYESTQPVTAWNTFDTAGYTAWTMPHNSDSSWDMGAFNNGTNIQQFNFGWGSYDINDHNVYGSKVYLVKITRGSGPSASNTFKKLTIVKLAFDTQWVFTYSNLDNSDSNTVAIGKAGYQGKLFAYHNLLNDTTYNREPNAKWDLLFTRYGAFSTQFGQTIFSANTGALSHPTVMTSKVAGIFIDSAVAGIFTDEINGIGADWKENPGPGQPNFVIKDSTSYFVKGADSREDKLVFTAFRGSSTGVIVFNKTNIRLGTGVKEANATGFVSMYPNPAATTITIELNNAKNCVVNIYDITGKTQLNTTINNTHNTIDISNLNKGLYFVSIETNSAKKVARLVVQ